MHEMVRRVAAVEATRAKFAGRPFRWGSVDCVKVAMFHLRKMGQQHSFGVHKAGSYRTPLSAKRALARAGHDSVDAALRAAGIVEIAPAMALTGDLLTMPGTEGLDAVCILAGPDLMLGFHEEYMDGGLEMLRIHDWAPLTGWRL